MKYIFKWQYKGLFTTIIVLLFLLPPARAQQNIDLVEYSIDTVPEYGKATAVNVSSPNANISNLSFAANIGSVADGIHTLYLRSRSSSANPAASAWSVTNYQYFFKAGNLGAAISKVKKLEYFIDTDPGFGNAITINVTAASQVSGIAFSPNIAALTNGFHVLFIRSLDQNGKWSITNYQYFYKQNIIPDQVSTLTKLEYFIDTDPGAGKGAAVNFSPATNVSGLSFNAGVAGIAPGFHVIFIRSRDANGKWSITNYAYFYKAGPQANADANIVKIEYFIDTDPGYFSAVNLPVTPAPDIANKNFAANITGLLPGLHYLNVRSLDSRGKWSVNAFDTFRISTTLAVGLLRFDAAQENTYVNVSWQTTYEIHLAGFEVEYSTDGIHFARAGTVTPLNSSSGMRYQFIHTTPAEGINFYRLKTIESDGSISYSATKLVNFRGSSPLVTLYPNPADKYFMVKSAAKKLSVKIFANDGKMVKTINTTNTNTLVDVSALSNGLYNVEVSGTNKTWHSFLLIIH